jgi:WD40 repeat protein
MIDGTNLNTSITDMESGKQLLQFKLAEGTPSMFAPVGNSFSPDGTRLATIGPKNTAKVYDLANGGRDLLTLEGHTAPVITISFSPDRKLLATTSEDKSVKLWDAGTGRELNTFIGHTHFTSRVVFSPDGTRLASGSFDSTVKVWDIQTGQELLTLSGHGASVWGIAFSPDGGFIATGSNDNTLRLWDLRTGEPLFTLPTAALPIRISFTPDSTRLVVSMINSETRIYFPRVEDLYNLAQTRVTRSLTTEECQQYLHIDQCPAER